MINKYSEQLEKTIKKVKNLHSNFAKVTFNANHEVFDRFVGDLYDIEDDLNSLKNKLENDILKEIN